MNKQIQQFNELYIFGCLEWFITASFTNPDPQSTISKNRASHGSTLLPSCRRHESLCHSKASANGGHFGHRTHRLERDETCLAHVFLSKKIDKPCTATDRTQNCFVCWLFVPRDAWNKKSSYNKHQGTLFLFLRFSQEPPVHLSFIVQERQDPPRTWHSSQLFRGRQLNFGDLFSKKQAAFTNSKSSNIIHDV